MPGRNDPFVFADWQDGTLPIDIADGPFRTADIAANHPNIVSTRIVRKQLDKELPFPEISALPSWDLEDIALEIPSSADGHHPDTPQRNNNSPWTIPPSLPDFHQSALTNFPVPELPSAPSLPGSPAAHPHDATLIRQGDDGHLLVDPDLLLRSLRLMAQGRSSLLFSIASGAQFRAMTDGAFKVAGLGESALQHLITNCKATGEKNLSLRAWASAFIESEHPSATKIALAACVRDLLDADCERLDQYAGGNSASLQAALQTTDGLLSILNHLKDSAASVIDEPALVQTLVRTLVAMPGSHALPSTMRAVALSVLAPAISQLLSALELSPGSGSDASLIVALLDGPSGGDRAHSRQLSILKGDDIEIARSILQDLATLRVSKPDHPLVSGHVRAPAQCFTASNFHTPDPDAILNTAMAYEKAILDALEHGSQPAERLRIDRIEGDSPFETGDTYTAAFVDLARRIETLSAPTSLQSGSVLSQALNEDCKAGNNQRTSLSTATGCLLESLRPLLEVQSRLATEAVLEVVFDEQDLLRHLDAHRQFHLFGNGLFLRRLQTALFDSSSSSPRDRLRVEGNFGLRMDARTSRWPPASSDLQLTLAGIISDSYIDTPGEHDRGLPGGLSFAVRTLSESEIAAVLDPSSPRALDFLRLQYQPPPGLEPFFSSDALDKYDSIFRFVLQLIRQLHLTKTTVHLLASRPRSAAHVFAHQAQHAISSLAAYVFDLGISAPWIDLMDSMLDADASVGSAAPVLMSALIRVHSETLDAILDRLFLLPSHGAIQQLLHTLFTSILQASALLATGTQSLAVETPDILPHLQGLIEEMQSAVTDLIQHLHRARLDREDADHLHMLALNLEGNGFFAAHQDLNWGSL